MGHRIIIAGGGTGGHIFPALAIAHALKKASPATEILFVGARGKMEMEKVPQAGFRIEGLDIAGFNRSSLIKNIGLPVKLVKSFLQVRRIFKAFRPDAAIGVGGYSSFPVLRYAQSRGLKTFLHESNSFAGKTNIMLGRKATRIFVATEGMEKFFPADRLQVTGNPVRRAIEESTVSRDEAVRFFGLEPQHTTVLSVGGSLGAKSINEALRKDLAMFGEAGLQVIWQTGKPFEGEGKQVADGKANVWCGAFITQMEQAYAAADVVISRAGAMAIAELCITGKPAVLVPFPYAAEDHQTHNARQLADRRAGILVTDADAAKELVPTVVALAKDEAKRKVLSENIRPLAVRHADEVIAGAILNELERINS
jgi:UDP-N-acetylglucosamine--N-acetylmuramyl-(pentapeptide) pyrophosphoryl-undecaprenol N-acetylglucosamine transferase